MKPEDRVTLAALGAGVTPEMLQGTIGHFSGGALRPAPDFCRVERDIAYGSDARHRLDLFMPVQASGRRRPVLVFVHGGGFVGGDKGAEGEPFYNNVGAWVAREGMLGVTITYRLAPDATWPAGSEDIAAAIAWLRANIGSHGGDPEAIFVMGQSAGAAHVAGYVALPRLGAAKAVRGAIMLSGLYDLTSLAHSPLEAAYYGSDAARFGEQSSLGGLADSSVACLFTVSELDPPPFQQQAAAVVARFSEGEGRYPRMLFLPGHNHLSPVLTIDRSGDPLAAELRAFIADHSR